MCSRVFRQQATAHMEDQTHTSALHDTKAVRQQLRLGAGIAKGADRRTHRIGVHVHVPDGHAVAQEQAVACANRDCTISELNDVDSCAGRV